MKQNCTIQLLQISEKAKKFGDFMNKHVFKMKKNIWKFMMFISIWGLLATYQKKTKKSNLFSCNKKYPLLLIGISYFTKLY